MSYNWNMPMSPQGLQIPGTGMASWGFNPNPTPVPVMPQVSQFAGADYGLASAGPPLGGIQPGGTGTVVGTSDPTWDQRVTGYTDASGNKVAGWGGLALGGIGTLVNAFMGMKQYGLAKDTLNFNKKQFGLNFEAQRQMTNSALEDRQRARVASNPGAYESVTDYMARYGVQPAKV